MICAGAAAPGAAGRHLNDDQSRRRFFDALGLLSSSAPSRYIDDPDRPALQDWESVRDSLHQLYYVDGKPLREVRDVLEQRVNFTACDRSFHDKLKQWGYRKRDKRPLETTPDTDGEPERARHRPFLLDHRQPSARQHQQEPAVISVPGSMPHHRECGHLTCSALCQHDGSSNSCQRLTNSTRYERSTGSTSREKLPSPTLTCEHPSPRDTKPDSCRAKNNRGCNEAIHIAAGTNDPAALYSAVGKTLKKGLSVDVRNSEGQSALEIAIRAGCQANVEALLNIGSALDSQEGTVEQPLHFAIRHSAHWLIIRLLLQRGAKVNRPVLLGNQKVSLLRSATQCHDTLTSLQLQNYLLTIWELVKHNAEFNAESAEGLTTYDNVLENISRVPYWLDDTLPKVHETLVLFLGRLRCNPFHERAIAFCPSGTCKTLAASILFHTPNTNLSKVLIDDRMIKRCGKGLFYTLIEPCRHACCSPGDLPLDDLLRHLLLSNPPDYSGIYGDRGRNPFCHVLAKAPGRLKIAFTTVLISKSKVSIHATEPHYGPPLAQIAQVEPSLRYELADILLQPELDVWWHNRIDPLPMSPLSLLIHHPWHRYALYFTPEYREHVVLYLNQHSSSYWNPDLVNDAEASAALGCIYHVVTKHLIEHALSGPFDFDKRMRLLDGLKSRQAHALPPLALDNVAVYNMLTITDRTGLVGDDCHGDDWVEDGDLAEDSFSAIS